MRILLVEDEKNLRDSVQIFLKNENFQVDTAENYQKAQAKNISLYDLVILDWGLGDGQGIDLLKEWRSANEKVKVLFLTARADILDRVLVLELGAQDYLVKPFDPRELLARIRVQLRDIQSVRQSSSLDFNPLNIDLALREVYYRGQLITLTKMEFELLLFLAQSPNRPFSREELLNSVWGYENFPSTRTVDNHILQLRQKIDANYFETIHGIGYRFKK